MKLKKVLEVIAEGVVALDKSAIPHKNFNPGVGPYGEPQLFKSIVNYISEKYPAEFNGIRTKQKPDILIPGQWAIECKIVRPYGDNGIEAEHWSQNLLHPYRGSTSSIGDIYKLLEMENSEKKAIVVVTYNHAAPLLDLLVIINSFEHIAKNVLNLPLAGREEVRITDLVHPIHQHSVIYGWQINKSHP